MTNKEIYRKAMDFCRDNLDGNRRFVYGIDIEDGYRCLICKQKVDKQHFYSDSDCANRLNIVFNQLVENILKGDMS